VLENVATPLPVAPTSKPLFRSRVLIEIVTNLFASDAPLKTINLPLEELLRQFENHLLYDLGHTFYEEAVFENPWLTRATEALRQQQAEVETSLYRLRRSSQLGNQTKPSTTNFRKQFEYFIDIFSEHDASIQTFMQSMHTEY
jgi:hypothetical protein